MLREWTRDSLLALALGFIAPRILMTAAELDLLTKLKDSPRGVEDLCSAEGWDTRGLRILMDALAAQGLLIRGADGKYGLAEAMERYLVRGGEDSILPMIRLGGSSWESWLHLTRIIQTGENPNVAARVARSAEEAAEETKGFIEAMDVVGRPMAPIIADSLDLSRYTKMLDVGGGAGTYTMAFLRKAPHMTATLFDLPDVVEIGRRRLSESGLIDRVKVVAGDYSTDDLPSGNDLALLSAIIHSNSREMNRHLFHNVYASLEPGGTILIRDHIMDPTRTFPVAGAFFAVIMLTATGGGNTYTFDEVKEDLESAGFKDVRMIREGQDMDQLVAAEK
ncbi:MAG: methyltransferase [Desulfomonilaceae bacterium]